MVFRISRIIGLLLFGLIGYFGWSMYHYFFDRHKPEVAIKGLVDNSWYADEVQCTLEGYDPYKVSELSIWLDDKPLVSNYKINAKRFSHPFAIATRPLPNGKHRLRAEVVNSLYAQTSTIQEINFNVDNNPLQAAFVTPETDCKVFQGRTLHIQFQVNKDIEKASIHTLASTFGCFKESKNSPIYEVFIPVDCEEKPNEYLMTLEIVDKVGNSLALDQKFQVVMYPFKKHTLNIPPEKVEAEKQAGISQQELEVELLKLAQESPKEKLWQGSFVAPIEIKTVSTEYGTIRTTQERGRYMHKAVDVLNTPKSVVWATQDGKVVLKERYEFSGNTIVVDHGQGVLSLFFHLDSYADISVGQLVKRGNPIGTIGKTGYASGYHLHWEMRINNTPVDPLQWVKPNF